MKRLIVCALAVVFLAGCHHSETVYAGPNGSVTVDKSSGTETIHATDDKGNAVTEKVGDGNVSMTNDKGESAQMGKDAVNETDLGLPFYPGSTDGGGSVKTEDDKQRAVMSQRRTPDDPDKVAAFYRDKIDKPELSTMSTSDGKMAILKGKLKNSDVLVQATSSKDGTTVVVTSSTKKS